MVPRAGLNAVERRKILHGELYYVKMHTYSKCELG
jgi:hypothetical protein